MVRSQVPSRTIASLVLFALVAGCGGSSNGGSPMTVQSTPTPTPTATPTSTATSAPGTGTGTGTGMASSAYTCPSSDSTSSVARGQRSGLSTAVHRAVDRRVTSAVATGLIGVTYSGGLGAAAKTLAVSRERAADASLVREMTFRVTGRYERILRVTPGMESQAIASLRTQANVVAATMTGTARREETVAQKYYSGDPYFNGFTKAQIALSAGATGNATYHVDPYEESSSVPGQWGDQAIRLGDAEEYSQANNGSSVTPNAGALGSSNVNIAVIDSGQDSTHPELSSKIVYQRCFITNTSNVQSTSDFSVDEDGHGTDVSGIAAAETNNTLGFVGSGGASSLYAYRVFPTPDDTCVPGYTGTVDIQCDASSTDIAAAIVDAVNTGHVNVISLSLGGGACNNGVDEDTTEGNAINEAIAAKIVVVAAAGNGGTSGLSAPACDSGVIAVGASALSDGVTTGTSTAPSGTSSSPTEYVASYSQYGSPAAAANSSSAWGIVAPGGDPNSTSDVGDGYDNLHWIENIWTSTPYMASATDTSFQGECDADFGGESTTLDCRTLIAGTSQATPLVAGAAALIIAANPNYQSPSAMKQLLFSTAHDIGDAHEGAGRLDLYRAMATAVGDTSLPASQ